MSRPQLHTEVYPTIAPETLGEANKGKVAVVTGAAQGIGRAISEALAKTGANLALLDLDAERQADTKARCEELGIRVFTYGCDVTSLETCKKIFAQIKKDLGPVDILVNNAGKNSRRPASMESFEKYWAGIELNLKGAMICSFQVLPSMKERGEGCIINIASRAGTVTIPFACAYSTGKAGLIRATACLQAELEIDGFGDKIHLYALHPGAVKTNMTLAPDPDVALKYPAMADKWQSFHKLFKCLPSVCGQTCAYLSTGRGKVLRGKYFDCEQDIGTVVAAGPEALKEMYELKVDFLGGLPNDGGTALGVVEQRESLDNDRN